jgi:RNA polymerase primary sigma factor
MIAAFEAPHSNRPVSPLPFPRKTSLVGMPRIEEQSLITRAQNGCRISLERLIAANIRLVYSVARRYHCRSYSLDDLVQEGTLGLILAIERFDASRGCRLNTYAMHWIRQAIARAAEQNDRMIHVPAQTAAEIRRLHRLHEEMTVELGREPTEVEVARASGVPEERVAQLFGTVQDPLSLEAMIGTEQDANLLEMAEDPNAVNPIDDVMGDAIRTDVRRVMEVLRDKERAVILNRYGLEGHQASTLDEISARLRISREGVRQIEARAIRKLRHALRSAQWE